MATKSLRRLVGDSTGAAAVVIALSMPIVVGGLGFGTEVGMWYFNQRKLQNAADVAAYAAAAELRAAMARGDVASSELRRREAALAAAARTGHDAGRGDIDVLWPPESGAFAGNLRAVEVRVRERVPRMFSALFSNDPVQMGGRTVALLTEGLPTCVLALHPSASRAVQIGGTSATTLEGCNVHANSQAPDAAYVHGNAWLQTDCISSSGGVQVEGSAEMNLTRCVAPYQNADVVPDPYQHLDGPSGVPAGTSTSTTLNPGVFTSNVRLQGTVHLNPGVYVFQRDFDINANATVTGNDVTLIFQGSGNMHINGNAQMVSLSAPTSGQYANILVFGARDNTTTHRLNGNASTSLEGIVYIPAGDIVVNGTALGSGSCMPIIAQTVTVLGTAQLDVDCTGRTMPEITSANIIRLVE